MNILILGSGGREHAFAWKISQSPKCSSLYIAPGNAGTASLGTNVSLAAEDFHAIGSFCIEKQIELVVVGPEAPLVSGIRDHFQKNEALKKIPLVGPGKAGALLEGSKDFSKQFMFRYNIPTAKAITFDASQVQQAISYLDSLQPPIVLKADGLAAGKGVIIAPHITEAKSTIQEMLVEKKFGVASSKVLVEEFLSGVELSVFILTDGRNYVILPEAKDYKRIGDNDIGPNTGGMGAVSPVVFADKGFMKKVEDRIVKPTLAGLQKEGIDYQGFIFIGLMNCDGEPYVIEYNVRMGDPETQAVFPRIKNDMVDLLLAAATGNLKNASLDIDPQYAVTVVMVSGGYPGSYEKGKRINGLQNPSDAVIFHAGTRQNQHDTVTDGGRILAVTGMGADLEAAREKAYAGVGNLVWDGLYFRKDIGVDLIKLEALN